MMIKSGVSIWKVAADFEINYKTLERYYQKFSEEELDKNTTEPVQRRTQKKLRRG